MDRSKLFTKSLTTAQLKALACVFDAWVTAQESGTYQTPAEHKALLDWMCAHIGEELLSRRISPKDNGEKP